MTTISREYRVGVELDFTLSPRAEINSAPTRTELGNTSCLNMECIVRDDAALTWSMHSKGWDNL